MVVNALNSKAVMVAAGVLAGGLVLYFVGRQFGKAAGDTARAAADAVARVNEGTPYEGTGPVGTIAHGVDRVAGGWLSRFGGWLGGAIYDATHAEYDPNAPATQDERDYYEINRERIRQ